MDLNQDGKCPCGCGQSFLCADAIAVEHAHDETGTGAVNGQATVASPELIEAEQDSAEILQPLPCHFEVIDRDLLSLDPIFPIHAGQEYHPSDLPPDTFDVASKEFKVYRRLGGSLVVFDGHHHFQIAKTAVYYVHSGILHSRLVAVPRELRCLVFNESDGWTDDLIKVLSQSANFEGKKAVVIEPEEVTAARDAYEQSFEVIVDCLAFDSRSVQILARDTKKNEVRVRQRATRWNSVNANDRLYPADVGEQARIIADAWAQTGMMTSEFEHPGIVRDCSNGRCEDKFASNPRRQTAVIHRIYPADKDDWVDIERTIKGVTPFGKKVLDAIDRKSPYGISTRFHVKGRRKRIDGRNILVADFMDILSFDDVENPAVEGAGMPSPVTDSVLSFLTGDSETYSGLPQGTALPTPDDPYLGTPFFGVNNNTANPARPLEPEPDTNDSRREDRALEDSKMYDIPRLIADFKATYSKPGANIINYTADGCKIVHALKAKKDSGDCVKDALAEFKAAFDSSTMAGYRGGAIAVTVASEMGGEVGAGWGSEIETATGIERLVHSGGMAKPAPHGEGALHAGYTPEMDAKLKALLADTEEKEAKKEMKREFEKAAQDCEDLKDDESMRDSLWDVVKKTVRPGSDMKAVIDAHMGFVRKQALGDASAIAEANRIAALAQGVQGKVLNGSASDGERQTIQSRGAAMVNEFRPWAAGTQRYLQATDDMCRRAKGMVISGVDVADPDNPQTQKLRRLNHHLMEPILEDHGKRRAELARDNANFQLATDSAQDQMRLLQESVKPLLAMEQGVMSRAIPALDTTTTAVILNQPSISEGEMVVGFQDLTALEFVMAMGPRGFNAGTMTPGFQREAYPIGLNLRIPSINYDNPSGWGYSDGFLDLGLQTPQNVGIAPGNTTVSWLNFGVTPRKISCILTWEAVKQIGNGPGDISLLAWELYMMAARESRTIDNALYNEMVNVAYEFQCVPVTSESYTTVNNLLVNNSQYNPGNAVVVNLNPQKKANAAVGTGDMSVTYPSAPPAGTQAIVAAVRLLAGGANTNAAPFYGFYNGAGYPGTIGPGPIVRPRQVSTLYNQQGQQEIVTTNAIVITGMLEAAVQGEVTSTGGIISYPGTTATFAVDYENGTLVFPAGSVTGAANAVTTSIVASYNYATNWSDFVADPALASANSLIPAGVSEQQWQSQIMNIVDTTAAIMGSSTNYVKPDTAISNLIGSSYYTPATIFAPLFSPPATELFPSPSAVAERSGIMFHRHNSSWVGRSQTLLLTRKGATFYAQDTPFQIMGPVTVQDNAGNPTGNLAFYGQEFSVIGTRQPIDINNNVLNCPNKVIILRLTRQNIGTF